MGSVLKETLWILNESAVYLLFGFLLAGVFHVLLGRGNRWMDLLSRRGSRSVVLAALLGVPMPLCSCSVIPAALTLRRKGATKGATVSYLISEPETDITSILLTYGLFGPVMAVFRPVAAMVMAIVAGHLTDWVDRRGQEGEDSAEAGNEARTCEMEGIDESRGRVWNALHYGFVSFFDDIVGLLLLGFVAGGLITALLPQIAPAQLVGGSFLSLVLMLVVGVPMYVCASSSTPIAAGLVAGGVSPGAALVFLLAGPATNLGSLAVLSKHLGSRVLAVYLGSIAAISLLMGLWLDAMMGSASFGLARIASVAEAATVEPLKIAGSIVLVVLSYLSLRRTRAFGRWVERWAQAAGIPLSAGAARIACLCVLAMAYAASGLFAVGPGERAMVTRFGRIMQANLMPGLHYRWPYPIGGAVVESVGAIRRMELGFRGRVGPISGNPAAQKDDPFIRESWMLTGNEDIIDIKCVVHYQVVDLPDGAGLLKYLYGIGDKELLVRCAAESAIRAAVGCRDIDTLLTTDRSKVERRVKEDLLQPSLDRCNAGLRVVDVNLLDVHAPPDVHWAFRDVASAAEDKMTTINKAWEYDERVVRQAEGQAARQELSAEGNAVEITRHARGEGAAFTDRRIAYQAQPVLTRLRLYLESMDSVLAPLKKYVKLAEGPGGGLDLWLLSGEEPVRLPQVPPVKKQAGDEDRRQAP